jgi:Mn-dependent DtxR family transcriptional regulator
MPGGRREVVDDAEILRLFIQSDDPILFTGEVADFLGFSNQGTIKRLNDLHERGLLASKKSGHVPAWWITPAGREFVEESDGV